MGGLEGWRLAFLAVALISITVGLLNASLGIDPVPPQQREKLHVPTLLLQMGSFLRLPTFGLIVLQVGPDFVLAILSYTPAIGNSHDLSVNGQCI